MLYRPWCMYMYISLANIAYKLCEKIGVGPVHKMGCSMQ